LAKLSQVNMWVKWIHTWKLLRKESVHGNWARGMTQVAEFKHQYCPVKEKWREGGREKGREKEEEGEKVANVSYLIDDNQVDSHLFGGKWVLRHPRSHCDGLFLPVLWFLWPSWNLSILMDSFHRQVSTYYEPGIALGTKSEVRQANPTFLEFAF
jgi:hypothetical protein